MIRKYPSLYLLCFVVTGIVLADRWGGSPYALIGLGAVFLLMAVWSRRRHRTVPAVLLLGVVFATLSAFHFSLRYAASGPNHLRQVVAEPTLCRVFGRVADWPELKPRRTEIVVALDSLDRPGPAGHNRRGVDGALLLKVTDSTTAVQRGDRVSFTARLYPIRTKPGVGYDYGRYLNLKGIFAQAFLPTVLSVQIDERSSFGYLSLVDGIRAWIRSALDAHLSPTGSALARGFLIGETREIPNDIYGMFRDSGTLHVLAVSGSNVALVLLFFVWGLRPFWLRPGTRAIILLSVIAVFAGLSYGDPSVVRASIMAGLVIGARLLKRGYDLNNVVALTALLILLVDPTQLFDVGFQLSFVTAWGLIFIVPRLSRLFVFYHDRSWYRWLVLPFLVVLVAQVCSTPIIAYYFDRVPVISPVANLAIVPLVSVGVLGIMALLLADFIWPLLGHFVGSLVNLLLEGVVGLLAMMGGDNIPVLQTGSLVDGSAGQLICLIAYLLLILVVLALQNKTARRAVVIVALVVANTGLAWAALGSTIRDRVAVDCLPIPGGVAVLVRPAESNRPDLIITGLTHRDYPVDERILQPLLRDRGVTRVRRMFVLSADFDALDDLVRLATSFEMRSLYLHRDMAPSLADIISSQGLIVAPVDIIYFGGTESADGGPGFFLSDDKVGVDFGRSRIEIVHRLTTPSFGPRDGNSTRVLVIGSQWTPSPHDWISLHGSGYEAIVCAGLEQHPAASWPDAELDPDGVPPDYLRDLSRTGSARFDLPL